MNLNEFLSTMQKVNCNIDLESISNETEIIKDLVLDSLEFVELIMLLEKEKGFRFELYESKYQDYYVKNFLEFL